MTCVTGLIHIKGGRLVAADDGWNGWNGFDSRRLSDLAAFLDDGWAAAAFHPTGGWAGRSSGRACWNDSRVFGPRLVGHPFGRRLVTHLSGCGR